MRVDEPRVAAAGNAEICVASLAGAVHGAAQHRDLEVLRIRVQPLLYLLRERLHAHVVATARRARDHHRAALAQAERLENLPGHAHLFDRVGGQRDAHRVADSIHEQRARADRALD